MISQRCHLSEEVCTCNPVQMALKSSDSKKALIPPKKKAHLREEGLSEEFKTNLKFI